LSSFPSHWRLASPFRIFEACVSSTTLLDIGLNLHSKNQLVILRRVYTWHRNHTLGEFKFFAIGGVTEGWSAELFLTEEDGEHLT